MFGSVPRFNWLRDGVVDAMVSCGCFVWLLTAGSWLVVGGWWLMLIIYGEFDPGSGRTLAACLTHASRTVMPSLLGGSVANG